jgi:hypothetical protein
MSIERETINEIVQSDGVGSLIPASSQWRVRGADSLKPPDRLERDPLIIEHPPANRFNRGASRPGVDASENGAPSLVH